MRNVRPVTLIFNCGDQIADAKVDDGYRLTYGGLDYLALHSHVKSSSIIHLGSQMGVGKESDIYLVTSPEEPLPAETASDDKPNTQSSNSRAPVQAILKIHRLGRTSFRSLTRNRAYHGNRQHCSWMYLSRLSAQKEFAAMKALYEAGFPVPRPIAWNRHTVVMSLVPGVPLRQVPESAFGKDRTEEREDGVARLYGDCMELTLRLAEVGCIHGDYNEFNILIENVPDIEDDEEEEEEDDHDDDEATESLREDTLHRNSSEAADTVAATGRPLKPPLNVWLIDFPQITSLSHPNAESYFLRDVACIKTFFSRKYQFTSADPGPTYEDAMQRLKEAEKQRAVQGQLGLPDQLQGQTDVETMSTPKGQHRRTIQANKRLDVAIAAAGFSKKMARELEDYYKRDNDGGGSEGEEGDGESGDAHQALTGADAGEMAAEDLHDNKIPETLNATGIESPLEGDLTARKEDRFQGAQSATTSDLEGDDLTAEKLAQIPRIDCIESRLASLSTTSVNTSQASRTKPKALAGWSI